MRRNAFLLLVALVAACTSSTDAPATPTTTSPAPIPTSSPSPTPRPEVLRLDPVTLEAAIAGAPRGWREVVFIPFGEEDHLLGREPSGDPPGPSTFAVDDEGGFWIADDAKGRLVHVLGTGATIGTIPIREGFRLRDVAIAGSELYGILDETEGAIAWIDEDGVRSVVFLSDGRHRLFASQLIGTPSALHVRTPGNLRPGRAGYAGFGVLDVTTGVLTPEPGAPTSATSWIEVGARAGAGRVAIRWYDEEGLLAVQPIVVELTDEDGREVPSVFGIAIETPVRGGVGALVQVSSSRGEHGGAWYLRIPVDPRRALLFDRMPPGVRLELGRHLAAGPGGVVHAMAVERDGVRIYRR